MPDVIMEVDSALWFLLRPRRRVPRFAVDVPATDTVGHVVRMLGIPPTEVGPITLNGRHADLPTRPTAAGTPAAPVLAVGPRQRPQPTRHHPPRFLLDVHLKPLSRRLRLLGLDAAWEPDAADAHLVERAAREERVLLTRDRGLLHRGALPEGALVRGEHTDDQLADLLDRFAPPLAPWTRCLRCGGPLVGVSPEDVADRLLPDTRRSCTAFSRCADCGHVYWRGAHARRLDAVVDRARRVLDGSAGDDRERRRGNGTITRPGPGRSGNAAH